MPVFIGWTFAGIRCALMPVFIGWTFAGIRCALALFCALGVEQ